MAGKRDRLSLFRDSVVADFDLRLSEYAPYLYSFQPSENEFEPLAAEQEEFRFGVLARDVCIKKYKHLRRTRQICGFMDVELGVRGVTIGLPPPWISKYRVRTFVEAYDHPELKRLVRKMIAKGKKRKITIS